MHLPFVAFTFIPKAIGKDKIHLLPGEPTRLPAVISIKKGPLSVGLTVH